MLHLLQAATAMEESVARGYIHRVRGQECACVLLAMCQACICAETAAHVCWQPPPETWNGIPLNWVGFFWLAGVSCALHALLLETMRLFLMQTLCGILDDDVMVPQRDLVPVVSSNPLRAQVQARMPGLRRMIAAMKV